MRAWAIMVMAGGLLTVAAAVQGVVAQPAGGTPRPSTQPTTKPTPADQLLNQMLRPAEQARRPLLPQPKPDLKDVTSGKNATAPDAPQMGLLSEGSFVVDRTGRIMRSQEGVGLYEFVFDADGRALKDPPMLMLPNSYSEAMEEEVKNRSDEPRFRITGLVTTYRGRNCVLVEKAVVVSLAVQQDRP